MDLYFYYPYVGLPRGGSWNCCNDNARLPGPSSRVNGGATARVPASESRPIVQVRSLSKELKLPRASF